jgi:hypothetical protein
VTIALLLALVTPMRSPAQALNPSEPAPLTTSPTMPKFAPHASADGQVVAVGSVGVPAGGVIPADKYVFDLTSPCCEGMLERLVLENEPSAISADVVTSPSISVDGRFVAYDVLNSLGTALEIRLLDRASSAPARVLVSNLPVPPVPPSHPGQLRPHPIISDDGAFVFYMQHAVDDPGNYKLRRISTAPGTPTPEPVHLNDFSHWYGRTQSPITADGSVAFALSGTDVVRIPVGTNGQTIVRDSFRPNDVTASADGKIVAWSSNFNYCTQTTEPDHVWVWKADGQDPDVPAAILDCDPTLHDGNAGGWLYQVPDNDPADLASRPFLTRDGRRLFFISTGNYSGRNPALRPALHGLSLVTTPGSPEPWLVRLVSHWSFAVPPLQVPADESVETATASADGNVVTYVNMKVITGPPFSIVRELRLVDLVSGEGVGLITDIFPPAPTLPFEANITTCTLHTVNDTVLVRSNLRQYRGGNRRVIVRFEADDGSGVTKRGGLVVQGLADGMLTATPFESIMGIDPAATQATCRVVVIDGAVVQPDVAVATRVTP